MNEIKTLMDILLETLEKKKQALNLINDMTKKQGGLISSNQQEDSAMSTLFDMKQTQIDQVNTLDDGFVASYERVKQHLINQPAIYKDEIMEMKSLIKDIGEYSIEIRINEMRNKRMLDIKRSTNEKKMGAQYGAPSSKQLAKQRIDAYSKYKSSKNETSE